MDLGALTVALIGGLLGGAAAAALGGLTTLTAQRRQHDHERSLEEAKQLLAHRADTYVRILEWASRMPAWVSRTAPLFTPGKEPPAAVPDEALFGLEAVTGAHASLEVRDLLFELNEAGSEFRAGLWEAEAESRGEPVTPGRMPKLEVHNRREAFHAVHKQLIAQINAELDYRASPRAA